MAIQTIGNGAVADDPAADDLRLSFSKANANFLELYQRIGGNLTATRAPLATDDSTLGYLERHLWRIPLTGETWQLIDPTPTAAVWARLGYWNQVTLGGYAARQVYNNLNIIGDSVATEATASGATTAANSSSALLPIKAGRTQNNVAVSGAQAADQAVQAFAVSVAGTTRSSLVAIGTNDVSRYKTGSLEPVFKAGHLAICVWLALPTASKVIGQGGTFAGTWANTITYGGTLGKYTEVNGNTATYTVYGSTVYVCSVYQNANVGTYSVAVDGVVIGGTRSTEAPASMTTFNGITYGPNLIRLGGLAPGRHTVVVTSVAVNASNPIHVLFVGGNRGARGAEIPQVLISNLAYFAAAGNTSSGTTDAMFDAYNVHIANNIADMQSDGLNVRRSNMIGVLNVSTDYNGDGAHWNNAGHVKVADRRYNDLYFWL